MLMGLLESMVNLTIQITYFIKMMWFATKETITTLVPAGLSILLWEYLERDIYLFVASVFAFSLAYIIFTISPNVNLEQVKKEILKERND